MSVRDRGVASVRKLMRAMLGVAWYPPILGVAFVLEVAIAQGMTVSAVVRPTLAAVAVGLTLAALLGWVLGGRERDGLERGGLAGVVLIGGIVGVRNVGMAAPLVAIAVLLVIDRVLSQRRRFRVPWQAVHTALTTIGVVLLVLQMVRLVQAADQGGTEPRLDPAWMTTDFAAAPRPDIFIILADAHGRADVLRETYGYDPAAFLAALEGLGFDVSDRSWANYMITGMSVASMLTGSHFTDLGMDASLPIDGDLIEGSLLRNPTFPLLRRAGYSTTVVTSGFDHVPLRSADRYIDAGHMNEFELALLSFVAQGYRNTVGLSQGAARERTVANLEMTVRLAEAPSADPTFVFTHIPTPHNPFAMDAECRPNPASFDAGGGLTRELVAGTPESVQMSADQTRCVDRLMADAVGRIVAARPEAIVIVMSDHGPEERLDWWAPERGPLLERSAILFAARTPGHPALFPVDITLVNVLPTLFNTYLGTQLPHRPNDLFIGPLPDTRMIYPFEPG